MSPLNKKQLHADKPVTDWWDGLTEEDKNLLKESESQYGKGSYISHQ